MAGARLREPNTQAELLMAVERADLIDLVSPLYNDSLPYLVSYAQERVAAWRQVQANAKLQRLVAIVNNGFPEPQHTLLATPASRQSNLST